MVWQPRYYRQQMEADGLVGFEVVRAETDLHISALRDLHDEAFEIVTELRGALDRYAAGHPRFVESFVPVEVEPDAPELVRAMAWAGEAAGVGPMAAVAGAIAERVAKRLEPLSREVLVENGGDLYLVGTEQRHVLLLAEGSQLSGLLALVVPAGRAPVAVCTSSGKVGHSVSLGSAHAVTIVADDGALADAAATAAANMVHGPLDIDRALSRALGIPGVTGAVVMVHDRLGVQGEVELQPVKE